MTYQIYTTINTYPEGKPVAKEIPFPKLFTTKKEAQDFGKGFFEPPLTVLFWRVQKVDAA